VKRKWLEIGLLVPENAGCSSPNARRVEAWDRQRRGVGQLFYLPDVVRRAAAVALDQSTRRRRRRRRGLGCRCSRRRLVPDVVL